MLYCWYTAFELHYNLFPFQLFHGKFVDDKFRFFPTLTVKDFKDLLRLLCMHFSFPQNTLKKTKLKIEKSADETEQ